VSIKQQDSRKLMVNTNNREWEDVLPPNSLEFKVRAVNQLMLRRFSGAFVEHGVTVYQYLVLGILWQEDGLTVSEVTDRLIQVGGTMTGIIQVMEKVGLITRKVSTEDRRVAHLWLTQKGRDLEKVLLPIGKSMRQEVFSCLNADEESQLHQHMDKLIGSLNQ
jgi:MarR family transcriptional regulator, organic hydroperoxide resistance regulator